MTYRVLMGKRGTDYGIWVSKPGQNVLTCPEQSMLLSSSARMMQVVQTGFVQNDSAGDIPIDIAIPNLGYQPFVLFSVPVASNFLEYTFPNLATLRITYVRYTHAIPILYMVFSMELP